MADLVTSLSVAKWFVWVSDVPLCERHGSTPAGNPDLSFLRSYTLNSNFSYCRVTFPFICFTVDLKLQLKTPFRFIPSELSRVGDVIGQVKAVDIDKDNQSEVFYEIGDGNEKGVQEISYLCVLIFWARCKLYIGFVFLIDFVRISFLSLLILFQVFLISVKTREQFTSGRV